MFAATFIGSVACADGPTDLTVPPPAEVPAQPPATDPAPATPAPDAVAPPPADAPSPHDPAPAPPPETPPAPIPAPEVSPATAPPIASAPPAAPQAAPPAARPRESRPALSTAVLILPFQSIEARPGDEWIGKSVQQSLLTDLITAGPLPVRIGKDAPVDHAAAAEAARNAGVGYVVFGLVHLNPEVPGAVRITAELVSAESGHPLGAAKTTGTIDNVFAMEDDLASQTRQMLSQVVPEAQPTPVVPFSGPVTNGSDRRYPWYDYGAPTNVPPDAYERHYFQPGYDGPYYDSPVYPPYAPYSGYYPLYRGRILSFNSGVVGTTGSRAVGGRIINRR